MGGGPPGGFGGPPSPGGESGMEGSGRENGGPAGAAREPGGPIRNGLQLGPPGRWWDDKHFIKALKLRPDQQRHMDAIFDQNRATLLRHHQELEQEEARMEALTHAKTPDETALFQEIDRNAAAHAEMEKALTHYLLQIRGEMDAGQVTQLEQHR